MKKKRSRDYEAEKKYSEGKRKLMAAGLDPAVYERRVKQLAKKYGR